MCLQIFENKTKEVKLQVSLAKQSESSINFSDELQTQFHANLVQNISYTFHRHKLSNSAKRKTGDQPV
jgi:hypothetical protein